MGRPRKAHAPKKVADTYEMLPPIYHVKGECKILKSRKIKESGEDVYLTYEGALKDALRLALMMLVKGFPAEYKKYADFLTIRALSTEECLELFNKAFKERMLTSSGSYYGSAVDAWGATPEIITAEIPGTELFFALEITDEQNAKHKAKMLENRCDCCLYISRKNNILFCSKCNNACRNVRKCPEGIGVN